MRLWLHPSLPWSDAREILVDRFPFIIGRRSDCDCPLAFAFISRQHCKFTLHENQVLVQDLESHNGTLVNGTRADAPLPLQHGDELTLGPISFRVVILPVVHETADNRPGLTDEHLSGLGPNPGPSPAE